MSVRRLAEGLPRGTFCTGAPSDGKTALSMPIVLACHALSAVSSPSIAAVARPCEEPTQVPLLQETLPGQKPGQEQGADMNGAQACCFGLA